MKNILLCFCLLPVIATSAQDKKAYDMTINGVKVIVVPSGNEIVQIDLVIKAAYKIILLIKQASNG